MPDTEAIYLINEEVVEAESSQKTTLRIKSVGYHRLKNLGNYENEKLEAVAQVQEEDNLEEVVLGLKEFVSSQLSLPEDLRNRLSSYKRETAILEDRVKHLEQKLLGLQGRWIEAKKVLAAHGVEVEELLFFEEPKTLIEDAEAIEFPPGAVPVGVFDDDDVPDDDDDEGWVEEDDHDTDDDDSPW